MVNYYHRRMFAHYNICVAYVVSESAIDITHSTNVIIVINIIIIIIIMGSWSSGGDRYPLRVNVSDTDPPHNILC